MPEEPIHIWGSAVEILFLISVGQIPPDALSVMISLHQKGLIGQRPRSFTGDPSWGITDKGMRILRGSLKIDTCYWQRNEQLNKALENQKKDPKTTVIFWARER
ncbi:MAG: hypothetical protein AAB348_01770 [Patescibacteria group bacterium]